jgi:hypothetical protein
MSMENVRAYAGILQEIRTLEDRLKQLKTARDNLEQQIYDYFAEIGVPNLTIDGETLYLKRELWAGCEEGTNQEQACTALRKSGLGDYASERMNSQGFSALIREIDAEGEDLYTMYPALKGIIKISEVFKIGHRKSDRTVEKKPA